jgi:hypothetical protein
MTPITQKNGSRTIAAISRIPDRYIHGHGGWLDCAGVGRWRASATSSSGSPAGQEYSKW